MKKKKYISRCLAHILILCLFFTALPGIPAYAQETSVKGRIADNGELSLEELKTARLLPEDRPEMVSEEAIAENGHVNRLKEQEEDLYSVIFQNRDGTKTVYRYNEPVKYKDKNGNVRDKTNKLSLTSKGDYTNEENDINAYFPKKLNQNKGVQLKFGQRIVEMSPVIKGNSAACRQTGHNKHFDSAEYVQYPDVFGEGISVRYTPTFEGYKEDIVLNEYAGMNSFTFRLKTDGLCLARNEDGIYCLEDPLSGGLWAQIGDLTVYDSRPFGVPEEILNKSVVNPTEEDIAQKEAMREALEAAAPADRTVKEFSHQYKVETVKQDEEYLITIVVDEDYLTDSERVYPVYVDPSISVSGSGAGKSIQDAPIYSGRPNSAFGSNIYNVVGYQDSTYATGRTLMKFPGLNSDSVYSSLSAGQITELQLHLYEGSGSTNNACIDLWQYNGTAWAESTAKYNNIDWNSYSNNFTWNYINSSGWQTFNLKSMVETWKSSPSALVKGIMLKNYSSESSSEYSKHFLSTESGYKPYLTYTYTTNVPVSQVNISPGSLSLDVGDTYYVSASVSPSNATNTAVYFESTNTDIATVGYTSGLVRAVSPGTVAITARSAENRNIYAVCLVTVTDPNGLNYVNITKDSSGKYSIFLTKFHNGDFYFQAYDEENEEWGELYSLSQTNKNWLDSTYNNYYNNYVSQGRYNVNSEGHKVYLAKTKLMNTVNQGTWAVSTGSDEFYGMWMHYTRIESAYADALLLVAQMVDTAVIVGSAIYQTVVTVKSLEMLANQKQTITSGTYSTMSGYVSQIESRLGSNISNRKVITAEKRNSALGYSNDPYKPGTPVISFQPTQTTQYVRVYTDGETKPVGRWMMKYSDIQGLTRAQIKDKFALPKMPTHYCYVNVPATTEIYVGIVNPVSGWGSGGGVQFELVKTLFDSAFGSGIELP